MKKGLLITACILCVLIASAQTTYYWVGGTAATSFTSNTNWNTQLNGGGTTRAASAATDVLIFDGTNVGGGTPATGTVNATATSTAFGQLKLQNGANVNLTRSAAGSATLTLSGDATSANDLVVDAGCTLTLGGTSVNFDVNIAMGAGATGLVSGTVYLSPLSPNVHTRSFITAAAVNSLVFGSGSSCYITDSTTTSGFNASVANGVLFKTGSSLYYYTGRSPIGSSSTVQQTNFESGSNLYFRGSNVSYVDGSAYGSSSWNNLKVLANVFIENGSTFKCDGPSSRIENLTVDAGSVFTTHTSGNTPITGNLTVNGTLNGPPATTNIIVMGGHSPQTISGTGTLSIPALTVANYSHVILARSAPVINATNIYGKVDFGTSQLTGAGTFTSRVNNTAVGLTGNTTAGSYLVTNVVGTIGGVVGLSVTGTGLDVNTNVVGFSAGNATVTLSKAATSTATASALTFKSDTAILATANLNGWDTLTGSVIVTDTKTFQSGTSYILNAATTWPFGVSSGSTNSFVNAAFVDINAPVTANRNLRVFNHAGVNSKLTLRPLDTLHITAGAVINGSYNSTKYIATTYNTGTGAQSVVQYDGVNAATTIPIGSNSNYLPVTVTPAGASDFVVAVFEGITSNGAVNGTQLSPAQKQTVVNAVWNINRLNGTGSSGLQLGWQTTLEGSTFTTLPSTDIGLIKNNGSSWDLPIGTGNNATNSVTATVSSFGSFSVGAVPPSVPFVFNPIPAKVYGNADFNGGATSLNTTQPIVYTSSNPLVATIVSGNIHIVGAGTSNITASQASDGFYPAASVTQLLTVNPAPLTITADNKTKFEGQANPILTATYSGFVLGETATVLTSPAVLSTTATTASTPGTYPITVNGAASPNYTITFVNGTLTVQAKQNQTITFNAIATKTYGNADFAAGATSTNTTIPITYASSNTSVATIIGTNIHIVGAGTANITASQAGNVGFFPAPDVTRTLTVNKANLTIRVRDTLKVQGQTNPAFTITYTGFVLGETSANLLTPPVATTTAIDISSPGYYPITLSGATSNNYNITYTNGRLTVLPLSGTNVQYMNAFMSNATTLTVRVYSPNPALGNIVIYDLYGRPLTRKNLFMPVGFINMDVPVATLPSGTYIVTVRGDNVDLQKTVLIIK